MINILDKKGQPLGLPCDYEYRGASSEIDRDATMKRSAVVCVLIAGALLLIELFVIIAYFNGDNFSAGGFVFVSLFLIGFAALFLWLKENSKRKHLQLLERIGHDKSRK